MRVQLHEYFFIISVIQLGVSDVVRAKISYNTIDTPMKRMTEFVPEIADKTCLLKPQQGPCRANLQMYYYHPENQSCLTFTWGGCQGNGNRFDTIADCIGFCHTKADAKKTRPNFCMLSFDYGYCFGSTYRWYFDKQWKTCKRTIYSGCGGNKNNFYEKEQCDQVCRFAMGTSNNEVVKTDYKKILIIDPKGAKTAKKKT